ncbi:MAG: P-loop NTPase [Gammaproteobacteria bacterium]|nr:P-loop NTPase [Gammaproteobacteria bacterium]MDH3507193.1 P-loop NTPase [Gammaproteobacteria bacterium]
MRELSLDQAEGLRRARAGRGVSVIAVTGGKGGVGKTMTAVNLGTALCEMGRRVMLLDADLGMANVDLVLGLRAQFNLEHVIDGDCELEDVVLTAPSGLQVVPASSGSFSMANLGIASQVGLIHAFSDLIQPLDVLLIDTAAGLSESVLTFSGAAQRVLVLVCDEPASITDAYGLIKVLSRRKPNTQVDIISNMTESASQGRELYEKLVRVSQRFLGISPRYLGCVPRDEYLRKAVQQQVAVVQSYPSSPSARAFKKLAEDVDKWSGRNGLNGGLEFFVERLVGADAARQEDMFR